MHAKLKSQESALITHTHNWMMEYNSPMRESASSPSYFSTYHISNSRLMPSAQEYRRSNPAQYIQHCQALVFVQSASNASGLTLDPLETFRLTQTERSLLESLAPEPAHDAGETTIQHDERTSGLNSARHTSENLSKQNASSRRVASWRDDPNERDQDSELEVAGIVMPYLEDSDSEHGAWDATEESRSP